MRVLYGTPITQQYTQPEDNTVEDDLVFIDDFHRTSGVTKLLQQLQ